MAITALPTPPSRVDDPDTFAVKADALLGALPTFVTEANALEANVNTKELSAISAASAAATSATNAANSATSAANSATTATTQATNSSNSATAAATSATNAANSATTASNAATTATNQANTATTQATNAATSATLASDWAQKTTGEVVAGQGYSAKYWAQQAASVVSDGVIDDAVTNTVTTWSSQKISNELSAVDAQVLVVQNEINTKATAMAIALS